MKFAKALLLAVLAVLVFAAASAEEITAEIVCEKEIPVSAEGAVIFVTEESYCAEEDIPFAVEWFAAPTEGDELTQNAPLARADMVLTDDGRLYCAAGDEIPEGLLDVLSCFVTEEDDSHTWQPDEALWEATDCLHPGVILERCSDCSAIKLSVTEGSHRAVTDKKVEPTSDKSGLTQGAHCAVCGKILVRQTVLPPVSSENGSSGGRNIGIGGLGSSLCDEIGHDYVDGYCMRCWEPCLHADIRVLITTSESHHFVCNDCGKRVVDYHTSEKGVCTVCGYHCGECEHPNVTVVFTINTSHYLECVDCGYRWLEPHTSDTCDCAVCGYAITPHVPVTDAAKYPTCTEAGLTEGSHCSVCGAVLTPQQTIPAPGHTPVTDAAKASTCTEKGLTEGSHCSVCGAVLIKQEVLPYAHKYAAGVCILCGSPCPHENVTAVDGGKAEHTVSCLDCGKVFDGEHDWRYGVCKICGYTCTHEVIKDGYIDSNFHGSSCAECDVLFLEGHEYANSRSCTCTVCGNTSHTYSHVTPYGVTRSSSCYKCGQPCRHEDVRVYYALEDRHMAVCRACNKELEGPHTFEGCSCSVCGYEKHTAVVTDAAKAPTCTQTGLTEGSHCAACGKVLAPQQGVPALGHDVVTDAPTASTCSVHGLTAGEHCGRCHAVLTAQKELPTLPHTFRSGACAVCGAPCPHEHKIAQDVEQDHFSHALHCADCGDALPAEEHSMAMYRAPFLYYCPVCGHMFV